jgi:hypothetical protein
MTRRTRVDDGTSATESKFYLPAGTTVPFVADRLESAWKGLFGHGVGRSA